MTKRAVIYARRSQRHQDASVETQVTEATRFIEKMEWSLTAIYRDDDHHTGRREFKKRKEFLRLLADAADNRFDVVVARDLSRIGGDTSRTMLAVEELRDEDVAVWCYIDGREVRLDDWRDKGMFALQSVAAEGERDAISSRTYEALMVRARSGLNAGGKCFGYDNVPILEGSVKKRTEYRVNEAEAAIVREIFQRYAEGEGLRSIVAALNQRGVPSPRAGKRGTGSWSMSVVREMLVRERYRGAVVYGATKKTYRKGTKLRTTRPPEEVVRVDVPDLRIVPEDLWLAVAARFKSRAHIPPRSRAGRRPKYMLSTLARCSECGGPIHAKKARFGADSTMLYVCGYHQDRAACDNGLRRPVAEVNRACIDWITANVLREEIVLEVLAEVRRRLVERTTASQSEVTALTAEEKRLTRETTNLAEAIARTGGGIDVLADKLAERQRQLRTVQARRALLTTAPETISLEVRRLEREARKRIENLRDLLERDQDSGRAVMEALLAEPLKFTPVQTPRGRRYRVEGTIATGALLQGVPPNADPDDPQCWRPQGDSNPC